MYNSKTNIRRRFYFGKDIPAGGGLPAYKKGDLIPKEFLTAYEDTMWYIYPNWTKFGTDKHAGGDFIYGYTKDQYVMRLPDTYLLREAAYLGKGDKASASSDVNVIGISVRAPRCTAAVLSFDQLTD